MGDSSLQAVVRRLLSEGMEPDVIADKVLADPELRPLLRGAVIWTAKHLMRETTREVEQTIRPADMGGIAARRRLVGHYFPLPDGTWVAWVEATANQHKARADWQRQHAAASIADAERHEAAAKRITEAGVTCLAELGETDA